ncbi:hypothetical protein VTO73DRAFT_8042 [Trametes versicolor]
MLYREMTTARVIRASASPSFSFSPIAYLSLPVPPSRMTFSTSSRLSSAYEDGRDRFNWQADVDEAYLPANYHGAERRHGDASDLRQDWWPHPDPTFPNMDLSQASGLLPHTLDAHHQFSFVENRTSISNPTTFVCSECPGKTWTRLYNLNVHIRTVHRGERPHACPDPACTRRFSRKHDMQRHFQSRHTNMGSPPRQASMG